MVRLLVTAGVLTLALAACSSADPEGQPLDTSAATFEAPAAAPADPGDAPGGDSSVTLPENICALLEGIDPAQLMSTAAGPFEGSDDGCSAPAADVTLFAQVSLTVGNAAALPVIRGSYEDGGYQCAVVDLDGLGDEAFTCLGGNASSHVVFAAGDHLMVFSAGNTVAGPPADGIIVGAAQRILETMQG